jgi:adenylyltransferase/sulfurtransferase
MADPPPIPSPPRPTLSPDELARYSLHLLLDEVGIEGQRKLAAGRVLVIGAGGLGSPAALYLAAAGIGVIGIADFDKVETHNLQRQLLHDTESVGAMKTRSAAQRIAAVNPHVRVVEHPEGVTADNAIELFSRYDIIVDGTDRFAARYLNNDAAFFARRPLVHGSVFKFEGQVAVFAPHEGGPCYRCLFPEPPPSGAVPGCGEAGVLGAVCGVIGSLQALEVLKYVAGIGAPLIGRLLTYDALRQEFQTLGLPRNSACPLCGENRRITRLATDLTAAAACAPAPAQRAPEAEIPLELSVEETRELRETHPLATMIIDVREPYELEICQIEGAEHIPMRQIPEQLHRLPKDKHLLVLCHSGVRSLRVAEFLRARGFAAVSNITGGIDAWAAAIDPAMQRY